MIPTPIYDQMLTDFKATHDGRMPGEPASLASAGIRAARAFDKMVASMKGAPAAKRTAKKVAVKKATTPRSRK